MYSPLDMWETILFYSGRQLLQNISQKAKKYLAM